MPHSKTAWRRVTSAFWYIHLPVDPSSNVAADEGDNDEDEEAGSDSDASGSEDEDEPRADRQTATRVLPLTKKRAIRYSIRGQRFWFRRGRAHDSLRVTGAVGRRGPGPGISRATKSRRSRRGRRRKIDTSMEMKLIQNAHNRFRRQASPVNPLHFSLSLRDPPRQKGRTGRRRWDDFFQVKTRERYDPDVLEGWE